MAASEANDTVRLANQAASLSDRLWALQNDCQHETTADEISTIARELALLSTTLLQLNDAINSDPTQYTDAFNEDLKEITTELSLVLEEILQCCNELMVDLNGSAITWFFKKGRVARLLKHLEALKGTLVVMRTVLWHGKDYGTHTSDRIAESNPHTMQEDRAILESVLASNRNAILDLHDLTNTISNSSEHSLERKPSRAGDHHRQLVESTGVEVPRIPDVLPPTASEKKEADSKKSTPPSSLRRRFSKRGVRLGVHMSILDLSANEAPTGLTRKWIQDAHLRQQQQGHGQQGSRGVLTALPELSRISEVDTAAGSMTNLSHGLPIPPEQAVPTTAEYSLAQTPSRTPGVPFNTPADLTPISSMNAHPSETRRERSSTVGSKLRRVMSKMSISNFRSPTRSKDSRRNAVSSDTTTDWSAKGKDKEDSIDEGDKISPRDINASVVQEHKPSKKPFMESLKQKFERHFADTSNDDKAVLYGRV